MIQDIGANRFHNEFRQAVPAAESRMLCYKGGELLVKLQEDRISFLSYQELCGSLPELSRQYIYLFSIDETGYFLIPEADTDRLTGYSWESIRLLRTVGPKEEAFAGVTGSQLARWYASRRFCPACGGRMVHDSKERMMRCPACGQMEYPRISPAVIVAVTDGERLLLTKYAGRAFKNYALIAGFAEIGETIEETVQREVMEEVGLKVSELQYYKSQPWSFTDTLLFGFFAKVEGLTEIHLDRTELSEGRWCTREEIPENDGISLTREMMQVFKEGRCPLSR